MLLKVQLGRCGVRVLVRMEGTFDTARIFQKAVNRYQKMIWSLRGGHGIGSSPIILLGLLETSQGRMRQVRISTVLVLVTTWAEKKILVEEKKQTRRCHYGFRNSGFISNFLVSLELLEVHTVMKFFARRAEAALGSIEL